LNSIAKAMNKSVEAVRMKLARLGLVVVEQPQKQRSTTREGILPVDIMTHKGVLKILAGAIARLQQPDLEKREVMQLRCWQTRLKHTILEMEKRLNEVQKAFGRKLTIDEINRNVALISRVVVHPKYRSMGLGVKLVKETLPLAGKPYVETVAVMAATTPFSSTQD